MLKWTAHNTYWNNTGRFQNLVVALQKSKHFPSKGEIFGEDKVKLEKFRLASNCYYDIFNNGGINRIKEIRKVFGSEITGLLKSERTIRWEKIHEVVEPVMDVIILEAGIEQELIASVVLKGE